MRLPTDDGFEWVSLAETASTQTEAANLLRAGARVGVVYADDQTAGRGRFGRTWISLPGESLTYSLIFHGYADHPRPHLVGMSVAVAVAGAIHCRLRWPNDLVIDNRKVGGILTELILDDRGRRIPIVGVGINLNQHVFPDELADVATSLALSRGGHYESEGVGRQIVKRLAGMPEPGAWSDLEPIWSLFDATPGKAFRLPTGETATALGIGSDGQLLCSVQGESRSVLAAEALFGS